MEAVSYKDAQATLVEQLMQRELVIARFTPEGPARGLWLLLHSLYVIAGTALSAVVVLTLTGVLRED